jgi:type I restriction enzyme S subunit
MKNWPSKTLGEVCNFSNGLWKGEKPPFVNVGVIRNTNFTKEGTLNDSDIAYLDVETKKLEKRRLKFGDIILEKSGGGPKQPVGRVVLFDKTEGDFSFSNFTASLRVFDPCELDFRFLHKFLHWTYLSGVTERMQSNSTGIRNLDGDAYKAIKISFPSLPEQRRIVAILDEADELRKLRTQADRRVTTLIPALFHEMFGDPETNLLGWPTATFEEVISSTKLGLVRGAKETDDSLPFPYMRMDAILGDGNLALTPIKRVNATATEVVEFSLSAGDFLFNTRNSRELVGKTALFEGSGTYLFNNNIMRIRFNNSIEPRFMIALFQTDFIQRQLEARKSGTTSVVAIYFKNLSNLKVIVPTLALQKEFAQRVTEIRELEASQATSRTRLDALFQSMLHRAFNGEL